MAQNMYYKSRLARSPKTIEHGSQVLPGQRAPNQLRAAEAQDHEARAAADLELAHLQRRRVAAAHLADDRVQRGDPARAQRLLILQRQLRPRELRQQSPNSVQLLGRFQPSMHP